MLWGALSYASIDPRETALYQAEGSEDPYEAFLSKWQDQDEHQKKLETEVDQLHQQLQKLRAQHEEMTKQLAKEKLLLNSKRSTTIDNKKEDDHEAELRVKGFLLNQQRQSEIIKGKKYLTEYDIIPYASFNKFAYFDYGNIKTNMSKKQLKEVDNAVRVAKDSLKSKGIDGVEFCEDIGGLSKTEPGLGTQHKLFFASNQKNNQTLQYSNTTQVYNSTFHSVIVFQPFGPLQLAVQQTGVSLTEPVHIVITLSGRIPQYQTLLKTFRDQASHKNQNVHLTAVYFGENGLQSAKNLTDKFRKDHHNDNVRLISVPDKTFTRTLGIEMAVKYWDERIGGNVLTFIADVDIAFRSNFLITCRRHAIRNEQVYFPIVFNQFNGSTVESKPPMYEQLPLASHSTIVNKSKWGRWKKESYGAVCIHSSDFKSLNMFDHKRFPSWGHEDRYLYRKLVHSKLKVVRATDPDIFHRFHAKTCSPDLPTNLLYDCIGAKALDFSTHTQLGEIIYRQHN